MSNTQKQVPSITMNPRLKAVLTIAKVRGYKAVSERQMALIHELLPISELSPSTIVDEVLDAPKERATRAISAARNHASNALGRLSQILDTQK